ncbi:TonB-dependent receptor [Pseudomonas sp. D2-5]
MPLWLALSAPSLAAAQEAAQSAPPTSTAAVVAAPAAPTTQLERIQVTGSAIRRVDAETAVPVTILRAEQLEKEGVTTTEQLLQRITGSQSTLTSSQSVGAATGGASFADLRGIGTNKTLVLLNGRRLANNAISGSAVDLNTIPFAAIERVEILRDGASALYGTDAIGGVINFITKRSVTDGQFSIGSANPLQAGGGESHGFSGSYGVGDLDEDRFNVFGVINHDKQNNLAAGDRSFTTNYDPGRGLNGTSGTAFPANYSQGSNTSNPLAASGCNGPNLVAVNGLCRFSTRSYIDAIPETEKTSIFTKATGKLAEDHTVSLEYFWSRSNNETITGPATLTGLVVNPGTPFYPGNGITPGPTDFALDPSQPVSLGYRETAAGPREERDQNTGQRLLLTFDGNAAGWDYNVGASYNENRVISSLTGGFLNDELIAQGVADGTINPFGNQSQAGQNLMNSASVTGDYLTAVGRVKALDGKISREIGDWFGAGPSAIALGGEYRQEDFHTSVDPIAGLVQSIGVDPDIDVSGDRSVSAQYLELNVPVLDSLELSAAIRHDKYSDFGNTTNPKYSFRFQPFKEIVFRGAYSEGFRAPSLYELYYPAYITYTAATNNDPVLCAGGAPSNGGVASRDCGQQFLNRSGGNTELDPENARNVTFGFVYQPVRNLSVGLDFWWIHIANQIAEFPATAIFNDPALYADRIVRAADGSIDHVVTGLANLGNLKTSGVDLSLDYRFPNSPYGQFGLSMNGTYLTRYDYQTQIDGTYTDNVGDWGLFRWKHTVTGSWNLGPWRAALTNRFQTGYRDYDPNTHERMGSYSVWDLSGGYTWKEHLDLDIGLKNLFDRDPPFTNQANTFQSGYDPRFTDPLGRTLFTRLTYRF